MTKSENIFLAAILLVLCIIMIGSMNPVSYIANDNVSVSIVGPTEQTGGIAVNVQDQTTPVVDWHLLQFLNYVNLSTDVQINQEWFIADPGHGLVAGDMLNFYENKSWYQAEATNVNVNNITVDTPFDFDFSSAGVMIERGNRNLAVDGSLNNIIFRGTPKYLNDTEWDVTRVILVMITSGRPDGSRFGDIAGGINEGIVVRQVNGIHKNIFNSKTNSDLAAHSYDVTYDDRASGSGFYQTTVRSTFAGSSKRGVVLRLDSLTNDSFEVIVQDDLTSITEMQAIMQGHSTQD